jgi:catechol 2,3-dioxygenase-like lactoylglutathione lyase family enzyme
MIRGLAHVCIGALDLDATERFYCDALECNRHFDFLRDGERVGFYLRMPDGTFLEAFRQEALDLQAKSPLGHLCFETDDLDGVVGRLVSMGFEVTEKTLGGDHSWQAWTTDPNGVRIEFHQYTTESCQVTGWDCVLD